MKRREFLIRVGSLAIWVPATRLLSGCAANEDAGARPALTFVSSTVNAHSHRLTLEVAILESPPSSGVQPETTSAAGHVHTVVLTEADLLAIGERQTVTKITSVDSGHSHVFNFQRTTATPTGGGDYQKPGGGYT